MPGRACNGNSGKLASVSGSSSGQGAGVAAQVAGPAAGVHSGAASISSTSRSGVPPACSQSVRQGLDALQVPQPAAAGLGPSLPKILGGVSHRLIGQIAGRVAIVVGRNNPPAVVRVGLPRGRDVQHFGHEPDRRREVDTAYPLDRRQSVTAALWKASPAEYRPAFGNIPHRCETVITATPWARMPPPVQ